MIVVLSTHKPLSINHPLPCPPPPRGHGTAGCVQISGEDYLPRPQGWSRQSQTSRNSIKNDTKELSLQYVLILVPRPPHTPSSPKCHTHPRSPSPDPYDLLGLKAYLYLCAFKVKNRNREGSERDSDKETLLSSLYTTP